MPLVTLAAQLGLYRVWIVAEMMDGAMGETGYWIKRGTGVRMKENLSVRLIKRERKRIEKRGRGEKGIGGRTCQRRQFVRERIRGDPRDR